MKVQARKTNILAFPTIHRSGVCGVETGESGGGGHKLEVL